MSKQYEHISDIRKKKYWLDDSNRSGEENPLLKDLQQSNKLLSDDIYRKDSHFLLELIQNAEDNLYDCYNPTLSFALVKKDPTNEKTSGGALIVSNNEIGFSQDNMNAMCSIGSSFKKKLKGYIGEKGIGFKSVFKVTKSPYIFSKGYQVRFPDEVAEIELGYIVPEWVDSIPKVAEPKQTTIILPLNKDEKFGFSSVSKMMREFTPETILFLSKITQLKFSVENEYEIVISKTFDTDFIVRLTILESVEGKTTTKYQEYLLYSKNFNRPSDLRAKNREDVFDRDITISFPVGETVTEGAVYAYLPVLENTGLPFILNADFLVPSSRDMISEDEEWNKWLRDQIPGLFIEAFVTLSQRLKNQCELFCHIPIEEEVKTRFFEPIAKQITERLSSLAIIPTEPKGNLAFPKESKSSRDFRKAITGHTLPGALNDRLIAEKLQSIVPSKVLQKLGISPISSNDVAAYLEDDEWISIIRFEGLLKLYHFLASRKKQYEEIDLKQYKIVPIKEKKRIKYSCYADQPIYFEATKNDIDALSKKPDCIKAPVRFLDDKFYSMLHEKKDIIEWMRESLNVSPFSLDDYAIAVAEWFKTSHKDLNDEQFVNVTNYILDHIAKDIKIEDFPVLLNTGKRILIPIGKKTCPTLVTPAGLDPNTGWKHIFITEADSHHLQVLSDLYLRNDGETPTIVEKTRAMKYPPLSSIILYPVQNGKQSWLTSHKYSEEEKRLLNEALGGATKNKRHEIYNSKVIKPSSLTDSISKESALAFVTWLNGRFRTAPKSTIHTELLNQVGWFYYNHYTKSADSEVSIFLREKEWLPTTKGLQRPSHVFVHKAGIYDILGDTVPYLEKEIIPYIREFLKIRDELTFKDIISYLFDLSRNGQGNFELAKRIYTALSIHEFDINIKDKLLSANCIAVEENGGLKWVSVGLCIWNDRRDLFADQFYYLSKLYPKLRDFFIDKLDVALDVGDEHYCALWKDIQVKDDLETEHIESKLTSLYNQLRPLFDLDSSEHRDWWHKFLKEAKLWSSRKRFVSSTSIYIPDDGNLKDIFREEDVDYLWYPQGSSYSQWQSLHSSFKVKSLKDSVSISLKDVEDSTYVNPAKYLTKSAKVLILVWLREKQPNRFQLLIDNGRMAEFVRTDEYRSDKLIMSYHLGNVQVEATNDTFMNLSNEILYYVATVCKPTVAAEICRALSDNEHDDHLENWINGVLGSEESDLQTVIKQKNWKINDDIKKFFSEQNSCIDNSDEDTSTNAQEKPLYCDPDFDESDDNFKHEEDNCYKYGNIAKNRTDMEGHGDSTHKRQHQRREKSSGTADKSDTDVTSQKYDDSYNVEDNDADMNIEDELFSSLNSEDRPIQENGYYGDSGTTQNPHSRYEKESDRAEERKLRSREQNDRYRIVRARILDDPDSQVREKLYQWYKGKCQICESTFYQSSNGKPFFISYYLVSRKISDAADTVGNSICLCANHFAQMIHGKRESLDVIEQLDRIDLNSKSFELTLTLDGIQCTIKYNQKHAIAFKAFYESHKKKNQKKFSTL